MREEKKLDANTIDSKQINQKDKGLLLITSAELTERYASAFDKLENEAKRQAKDIDFDSINKTIEEKINFIAKSAKKKKQFRKIRQMATIVAVLVLALTITFCGLMKYSIAFRATIHDWFTVEKEQAVSVDFGTGGSIPYNWSGKYAPTNIPTGFMIVNASSMDNVYTIEYQNEKEDRVTLTCVTSGAAGLSLDNENGKDKKIKINGSVGKIFDKSGDSCSIHWVLKEDGVLIKLYTNLPAKDAIKIAKSVKLIQ